MRRVYWCYIRFIGGKIVILVVHYLRYVGGTIDLLVLHKGYWWCNRSIGGTLGLLVLD